MEKIVSKRLRESDGEQLSRIDLELHTFKNASGNWGGVELIFDKTELGRKNRQMFVAALTLEAAEQLYKQLEVALAEMSK